MTQIEQVRFHLEKEYKQQEKCQILIRYHFKECKVYLVQIIPDNDSLQGRIQSVEVMQRADKQSGRGFYFLLR